MQLVSYVVSHHEALMKTIRLTDGTSVACLCAIEEFDDGPLVEDVGEMAEG